MDYEKLHAEILAARAEGKPARGVLNKHNVNSASYWYWKKRNGIPNAGAVNARKGKHKRSAKRSPKFVEFTAAEARGVEFRLKDGSTVTAYSKDHVAWLLELCR